MADKRLPKRRLDHIAKLQWEIDAWLQHCINWEITMNMSDDHSAKQIKALGTAQQAIFDAFGQPAMEHKVKHDDPIDDDAHAGKSRQELLAYVTNLEWTVRSRDESIQEYITILGDD